jgi:hypothetical protein
VGGRAGGVDLGERASGLCACVRKHTSKLYDLHPALHAFSLQNCKNVPVVLDNAIPYAEFCNAIR